MSWQLVAREPLAIQIHLATVIPSFFLGTWLIFFSREGSEYHRILGSIYLLLITLSGLVFEIGLTRIYSATIWYHYAFVAVSVALLGWGLGGVALHLLRRFLLPTREKAAFLAVCYAAAIVVCLWTIVQFPFR